MNRLEVALDLFKRFNSLSPGGIKPFFKIRIIIIVIVVVVIIFPLATLISLLRGALQWKQDLTATSVASSRELDTQGHRPGSLEGAGAGGASRRSLSGSVGFPRGPRCRCGWCHIDCAMSTGLHSGLQFFFFFGGGC